MEPNEETPPVTITVRGIELGRARPEIIVPLVGDDHEAVLEQAQRACETPSRVVEWRLDHFRPDHTDPAAHRAAVLETLPALRGALGPDRALLATLRTTAEGGQREISDRNLLLLLEELMTPRRAGVQALVDLVDIEASRAPQTVAQVVETADRSGVKVIVSHHDFESTPSEEELVAILRSQRRAGADLPKIAVTPQGPRDVLTLLSASLTVAEDNAGPHIALSMGPLGAVTRVAGETFASAATFATAGRASAPGQLAATDVAEVIEMLRP